MRKVTIALSALSLLALAGCEDGPKQTYEPAPAGAADNQNDGKTPPSVDSAAQQGFLPPDGGANTGTNAEMICSTPEKKDRINRALHQPIIPPRFACGIDSAGGDSYQGITIEQVEQGYKRIDFLVDGRYPNDIDVQNAGTPNATVATAASRYKGNDPNDPNDITKLCQGDNLGDFLGDGENTTAWGDNQECFANYSVTTHKIGSIWQQPGYLGAMTCYSRPGSRYEQDGAHVYTVPMYSRVLKDGMAPDFSTDWTTDKTNPNSFLNELYDACLFTFASFITPEDGVLLTDTKPLSSAAANGHLVIGAFSDGSSYWYVPAIGFGWLVSSTVAGPETATTPSNFQMYRTKALGFSTANFLLKMDQQGPIGLKKIIGVNPGPCQITMGMTYADFINNCVAVTGDDTKNAEEINKLLGGKTNGRERYFLDVQGIDVNFSEAALPDYDIIHDGDVPSPEDYASSITWDQSALGEISNDYVGNDPDSDAPVKDYHGGGLVWLEMARLAQADIQKLRTDVCTETDPMKCKGGTVPIRTLGDPACLGDNVKSDGKGGFIYAQGCTGLEGFVTTAPPLDNVPADEPYLNKVALGVGGSTVASGALKVGLKPGQPKAVYCLKLDGKTAGSCTPATGGQSDSLFNGSFHRVLEVFAGGDFSKLPTDIKDARFFFKAYFRAFAKYMIAVGQGTEDAQSVHNVQLDYDALFFDSLGAGQFENGEYIDRRFVAQTGVPLDIQITADVKNGILNDYDFGKELYRGEEVLYKAMLDRSAPDSVYGGKGDDVLLSNIFGSPVLATWTALPQCATAGGSKCPAATVKQPTGPDGKPVLGQDGKPLLAPYLGGIAGTSPFALGFHTISGTATDPNTNMPVAVNTQIGTEVTLVETDFPALSAKLTFPLRHNPYDNSYFVALDEGEDTSKPLNNPEDPNSGHPHFWRMVPPPPDDPVNPSATMLIPYLKHQPGVGFTIPLNGMLNRFITTAQLDLSGTTITANIDIDDDPTPDVATKLPVPGAKVIKAVETSDFLGLVFLCRDADSGELLTARMYDPAATILDWINNHPAAASACDFVVRFSPYSNFPDYITSRKNGVTVAITQGGGFGRVVDVTLFDPNTSY